MTDLTREHTQHTLSPQTMEAVLQGDLSRLTPAQRVEYYMARCASAGLDPRTVPFQYILLSGKLTLYATKTATEQAAANRSLSISVVNRETMQDIFIVTVRVSSPSGRFTESIGAVNIQGLRGEGLANAFMKAETKAKRRAVLAYCGLGMLDDSEEPEDGHVVRVDAAGAIHPDDQRLIEAPPADPQRFYTAFKELWIQTGRPNDTDLIRDYCRNALGRAVRNKPPQDKAEDLECALNDLKLWDDAYNAAIAAYTEVGGDAADEAALLSNLSEALNGVYTDIRTVAARNWYQFVEQIDGAKPQADAGMLLLGDLDD